LRNAQSGPLELIDTRRITTLDRSARIDLGPNFSRFIDAAGNVMARVKWSALSPNELKAWQVNVDQAVWSSGL